MRPIALRSQTIRKIVMTGPISRTTTTLIRISQSGSSARSSALVMAVPPPRNSYVGSRREQEVPFATYVWLVCVPFPLGAVGEHPAEIRGKSCRLASRRGAGQEVLRADRPDVAVAGPQHG